MLLRSAAGTSVLLAHRLHALHLVPNQAAIAAGCVVQPLLPLPRVWVVLHPTLCSCNGVLDGVFVQELVSAEEKVQVEKDLKYHRFGWFVIHT